MKTQVMNRTHLVFILATVLMVFGIQKDSYGQTITASTPQPLTEATLHGSVVTLTLNGGTYERSSFRISNAITMSGIDGVTFESWDVDRVNDTEVTIELEFAGNIDVDAILTFTVGAGAIAGYNGNALTATLPVSAVEESLVASTEAPLTEATLDGSIITLTLGGRNYTRSSWDIERALTVSGIDGVIVDDVRRVSDTETTVELEFSGNIDTDVMLTFTVGADAIVGYDKTFTSQFLVTAVEESLTVSTEVPLTETTLDGNMLTLTLTGRRFVGRWYIRDAVSVSGIDGVTFRDVNRVSDTQMTIVLRFSGNIDTNTTLTLTVGADAIAGYDKAFTSQFLVTAVKESLVASTEAPLTETTLDGSIITLTLTGRRFVGRWDIRRALSASGIDGITFRDVDRVSDTQVTVALTFSGNIDTNTTLTLTVGADAIVEYDKAFTSQFLVTAVEESLVASTEAPLTEATLHGSIITLTLTGRRFADEWYIEDAVSVSGIDGVTFPRYDAVDRVSDTVATVELEFAGNIDTDATLTLTVGADAIAGYNKAFTSQFLVTAVEESLVASTEAPLTEATLHGSIITLTLTGRRFADRGWVISVSGIDGVTIGWDDVRRVSDTVATVALRFSGNIDTDATLTLTVGADTIAGGYDKDFTFQFPVTAVEESLEASTEAPLTEATLYGSPITLTLTGRRFADREQDIEDAVSVSGIDGVTLWGVTRVSDTVAIVALGFSGNIDTDATLTLTVGPDAIGFNKTFTFQFPVTAVEESLDASTEVPLTEATLDGSVITLSLTGARFTGDIGDEGVISVSGIDGVTVDDAALVSYTEATVYLAFSGNIDTDATLTLTVGTDGISYNQAFTFQFPVATVEESLDISTAFPLTEATLHGSVVTLTLTGHRFDDEFADGWYSEDAVSISGIDGVTFEPWTMERVSDTEVAIPLEFDGTDFDIDATLTFTVDARAIARDNQGFTAQIPVTAIQQSNATVSISPVLVVSPAVGEQLRFTLNIRGGENVAGYQLTVSFDRAALRLADITSGDYLPADPFLLDSLTAYRSTDTYRGEVSLTATTLAGAANGNGTLAALTFEVEDFKPSTLALSQLYLIDADGKRWEATTQNGTVTVPPEPAAPILGDINRDGMVNIQDLVIVGARFGQRGPNSADINGDSLVDIVDLVLVASAFDEQAAAPAAQPQVLELFTAADVRQWLNQAQGRHLTDPTFQSGIRFLEQLLTALAPKETALLPNYPNPFNPETWIPYHLSNDADVQISIYDTKGVLVRRLDLGHQMAGYYTDRAKAAYWNGRNESGESVANGLYFYQLRARDYTALRRMVIVK